MASSGTARRMSRAVASVTLKSRVSYARIGSEPYLQDSSGPVALPTPKGKVTRRILSTALISAAAVAALLGIPANADDPTPTATASPVATMVETMVAPEPTEAPTEAPTAH